MTIEGHKLRFRRMSRHDVPTALLGAEQPGREVSIREPGSASLDGDEALVVWANRSNRPSAVVCTEEAKPELFASLATFHGEIAPLTSWCTVVSVGLLDRFLPTGRCDADLVGLEASWAAAAVVEAMLVRRRPFEALSLAACLATDAFAFGRTAAVYGARMAVERTAAILGSARGRLGGELSSGSMTTLPFEVLLHLLPDAPHPENRNSLVFVEICRKLQSITGDDFDERGIFAPLSSHELVSSIVTGVGVNSLSAEDRVRLLRKLRSQIVHSGESDNSVLLFLAGYIISRIGGAERDFRLAESFEKFYGTVLSWAVVLGSLGASTYWTDAFGGLGRLVARELVRPVDIADPPTSDISAEELLVVGSAPGVSRLPFRAAQRASALISIQPGVVVPMALNDERLRAEPDQPSRPSSKESTGPAALDQQSLRSLARQLYPALLPMLDVDFARRKTKRLSPELPLTRR